jgi:hypothetical protein
MFTRFKEIFKTILLFPALIISIVIALPLGLFGGLIDLFLKPRRTKRLFEDLNNIWIPKHKYLFFHYDTSHGEDKLIEFIEKKLIPKYEKYLVVDSYPENKLTNSVYKSSASTIYTDYIQDFDGDFQVALVTIDPVLNLKSYHTFFNDKNEEMVKVEKTKDLFVKKIDECLKEWQKLEPK